MADPGPQRYEKQLASIFRQGRFDVRECCFRISREFELHRNWDYVTSISFDMDYNPATDLSFIYAVILNTTDGKHFASTTIECFVKRDLATIREYERPPYPYKPLQGWVYSQVSFEHMAVTHMGFEYVVDARDYAAGCSKKLHRAVRTLEENFIERRDVAKYWALMTIL